jgi:translocation and assembly module TamB
VLAVSIDRLISTEQGLLFAFNVAQKFIPGQLKIDSLHGTLNSTLIAQGVHYHNADTDITIKQATINWQPNTLLNGRIIFNSLHIDNLTYRDLNPNKKFAWPNLEFLHLLTVSDFRLNSLIVQPTNLKLIITGSLSKQWNMNWQMQQDKLHLTGTMQGIVSAPRLQTHIPQVAVFANKLPNLKSIKGELFVDVTINKVLSKPELSGAVILQNASVDLPDLGLHIQAINIKAQGDHQHGIRWQGHARSGTGEMQLTGLTQFTPQLITTLRLQAQNILVMNTPEYQINATPDLTLKLTAQKLDLTGNVLIPKALFKIGNPETHALGLSNDVVFIDKKKSAAPALQLPLQTDITLTLGDDVQLYYQNLKTTLRGDLHLIDQPDHPTLATGQINLINGEYVYYGQKLIISAGSHINYAGNAIDNPNLNIQATRSVMALPSTAPQSNTVTTSQAQLATSTLLFNQPSKVTVGVNVQGNAQHPVISLFANPSILNQVDTLSYLVTGQAANQLNASNAQLLFSAANSLNPGAGKIESLMDKVQKATGLTKFSVESTNIVNPATNSLVQNTSVVLGKTLTPKMYITYSVGLLQPINILQLNYILNKYLTLQTSSSTFANGLDLLYKIEKE